ncbi:putative C-S lyase [Thermanaerosceptrum fracticalcis]|uniref:cysteine-S-conjugate beta-lyase n=1 Tax=Thermanaerosceptrum fracticalcis TaxID=1712410 RepID=A0A7G6E6Z2_THEFR|nr:MalY/PatB family protein [Thermanaerosceptrum fracticalcis]QNB47846.1 putative C-S lyase [Thermanaerosceptrum fracticalcis]
MKYDFDRIINRHNTYSEKWDHLEELFGSKDILPMWVADMDFQSPPAVVEAIKRRAAEGIYGYTFMDKACINAFMNWFSRRHGWKISPQWITECPGVVTALSIAVDCFTKPGDRIIIQPPVYYPFFNVVKMNGRSVVTNSLVLRDNFYTMDYTHLETLMQDGATMLILSNPHNPGGRVWSREELERLGELCHKYKVMVISDEIHCDLVFRDHKYTPFASVSSQFAENSITCVAPTKTFNLPGIQASFIVIPNEEYKRIFDYKLKTLSLTTPNFFVPVAVKACYEQGEEWLEELLQYVKGNLDFALGFIAKNLPQLEAIVPEGTYLLWVDCRKLGLDAQGMKELMYHKARVAFSEGSVFGPEGEGFVRINLACPQSVLEEGLKRFYEAVRK